MKRRGWLPLAALAGLAVLLGLRLGLKPREVPPPFIGRPAPAFSLPQLSDGAGMLSPADMMGRVWVLNVWASWCAPCREEHPLLVAVAREQQVPLLGLNYKDDPRAAQEWLRFLGDPYMATASDRDGRAGTDWGVYGVPETFVIDQAGIVRHKHVGPITEQVWKSELLPLIHKLKG